MKPKLQFYFRQGCHLCEDMWQQLLEEGADSAFELESFDIDRNHPLNEKYGTLIPVLEAEGRILCCYYLDRMALHAYLGTENA